MRVNTTRSSIKCLCLDYVSPAVPLAVSEFPRFEGTRLPRAERIEFGPRPRDAGKRRSGGGLLADRLVAGRRERDGAGRGGAGQRQIRLDDHAVVGVLAELRLCRRLPGE